MTYWKQVVYDMRHQKMMTWVAVSGTAVSIFLVMVYFMVENLKTVEVSPEINRERIYGGWYMHLGSASDNPDKSFGMSGGLDYSTARMLYEDLEGVEKVAYTGHYDNAVSLKVKDNVPEKGVVKSVDGNFWDLFRFDFIEGSPFTESDCLATTKRIVLTHGMAHRLFGATDVVGREVTIWGIPYLVSGVVEDVNPILENTWADAYQTLDEELRRNTRDEATKPLGQVKAFLLLGKDTDPEVVKHQVESRYATLNSSLLKHGTRAIWHGQPYDAKIMGEMSSRPARLI